MRVSASQKFKTFNTFNTFGIFAIFAKFANLAKFTNFAEFTNFDAALAYSTPPHIPPRRAPDRRRIPSLQSPTGRVPMSWMEERGQGLFN